MIFMPGTHRHTKQDTARIIAALEAKLASFTPLPFAAAARQPLRASCGRQRTWA
jgi:hypothetical protein